MTTSMLYLVAPSSLRNWFTHFADLGAEDEVVFTGEDRELDTGRLRHRFRGRPDATVVFYSGHDSLERDCVAAESLRAAGIDVRCQSSHAALLGTDKFAMKMFFDQYGFTSPDWGTAHGIGRWHGGTGTRIVIKSRGGTQSVGTRLGRFGDRPVGPDELFERYCDGEEYSVLVHRAETTSTFPPVWKGATSTALVPPWQRLRLCPAPGLRPDRERALRATARDIARAARVSGFVEVEFLLATDGSIQVLEINPRVCGTMRIAGMATGVPVFAQPALDALPNTVTARRPAAEVPYDGRPISDPDRGVFATSRLTVSAERWAGVHRILREFGVEPSVAA